jgi:hypothetical protein
MGGFMSQSEDEMRRELERLKAENEALKAKERRGTRLQVSEKGGVSLYGMRRFPITFYKEEWERILEMADEIRTLSCATTPGSSRPRAARSSAHSAAARRRSARHARPSARVRRLPRLAPRTQKPFIGSLVKSIRARAARATPPCVGPTRAISSLFHHAATRGADRTCAAASPTRSSSSSRIRWARPSSYATLSPPPAAPAPASRAAPPCSHPSRT